MKPEKKDLNLMLETAITAARMAGRKALESQNHLVVSVKNGNEIVTQADSLCQQIIIEHIRSKFPEHGFIAEEGKEGTIFKQPPKTTDGIWWVIDPIDGTNNFAHQMPFFSVSIAAMKDGLPIVGVVFEPATDSMFTAVKNGQAKLNDKPIYSEPACPVCPEQPVVSEVEPSRGKLACTESCRSVEGVEPILAKAEALGQFSSVALDSYFDKKVAAWANKIMQITKFRNFGSTAMHLAYTAKGSLAAGIFSHAKLWDIAAGALIAESAGAIVSGWNGEQIFPVNLDSYSGQPFKVVAANKKAHSEIIKLINSD
jgi:myo-inositol-1(or 4)-monophosphatase